MLEGTFRGPLGYFGYLFGTLWIPLGYLWVSLGGPLVPMGSRWGPLGHSGDHFGHHLNALEPTWGALGLHPLPRTTLWRIFVVFGNLAPTELNPFYLRPPIVPALVRTNIYQRGNHNTNKNPQPLGKSTSARRKTETRSNQNHNGKKNPQQLGKAPAPEENRNQVKSEIQQSEQNHY